MTKANTKAAKHKPDPKSNQTLKKTIKKAQPVKVKRDRPPGVDPRIGVYPGAEPGQPGI